MCLPIELTEKYEMKYMANALFIHLHQPLDSLALTLNNDIMFMFMLLSIFSQNRGLHGLRNSISAICEWKRKWNSGKRNSV